jgi:hypothetical protein
VIELKRKQTAEVPEPLLSSTRVSQSKSKARRVSTDAQEASHDVASHQTTEEAPVAATAALLQLLLRKNQWK